MCKIGSSPIHYLPSSLKTAKNKEQDQHKKDNRKRTEARNKKRPATLPSANIYYPLHALTSPALKLSAPPAATQSVEKFHPNDALRKETRGHLSRLRHAWRIKFENTVLHLDPSTTLAWSSPTRGAHQRTHNNTPLSLTLVPHIWSNQLTCLH